MQQREASLSGFPKSDFRGGLHMISSKVYTSGIQKGPWPASSLLPPFPRSFRMPGKCFPLTYSNSPFCFILRQRLR